MLEEICRISIFLGEAEERESGGEGKRERGEAGERGQEGKVEFLW